MAYDYLLYETEGELGTLTLNRPESVNSVNRLMMEELLAFWEERQQDLDTRVIILHGSGEKGFCSGLDLKDTTDPEGFAKGGLTAESIYYNQSRFSKMMRMMRTCPQPIICNIHGYAMGAGLSLALASDMRLASPDAVFCAQYINIGVGGADLGSAYFLWRLVGWGKTVEMCMTGDRIPAEEAHRIGLVNNIYEKEQLMEQARALAYNLLSKTKLGLSLTKEVLNAGLNLCSLEEVNKMENRNQAFMLFANLVQMEKDK
jgi:enoyl-CoA hydratase/carnithine racemase